MNIGFVFVNAYREREYSSAYLAKKRSEGKHYNVAISHAAKKLIRVIYHLEKTQHPFISSK